MPEHLLTGARMKLARAKHHYDELDVALAAFNRSQATTSPVEFSAEMVTDDAGVTWQVLRWEDLGDTAPVDLALVLGDAVHNSRSALDHLACALVQLNGSPVLRTTAFPIFANHPGVQGVTRNRNTRLKGMLKGMSRDCRDRVESLQPYANPRSPSARILERLAILDNTDKHRLVHPVLALQKAPLITNFGSPWADGRFEFRVPPRGPVAEGSEAIRFRCVNHKIVEPLTAQVVFLFGTAFGDVDIGMNQLREIEAHVVGIVDSFAPAFS